MIQHRKFFRSLPGPGRPRVCPVALLVTFFFALALPGRAPAAAPEGSQSGGGIQVPLVRTGGNHFGLEATIDGHRALLDLDTGAPLTLLDQQTYERDVPPEAAGQVPAKVSHFSNIGSQSAKTGWVQDLQAGPMHFGSGPVVLTDLHAVSGATSNNYQTRVVAGFLGDDILTRYGAVIYWANKLVYFSAHAGGHLQIGAAAVKAGWTAIPMEITSGRHFAVPCSLGGSSHLVVDTGAFATLIDKSVWADDITRGQPRKEVMTMYGITPVSPIILKHWNIGKFQMTNSMVGVGKFSLGIFNETTPSPGRVVGVLGSEWLYFRNAIIDVGGMTLYLKAPAA
jgi:predicted aspartyl protease